MVNKHFLKTVLLFAVMIGIALIGVYWANNQSENNTKALNTANSVAK